MIAIRSYACSGRCPPSMPPSVRRPLHRVRELLAGDPAQLAGVGDGRSAPASVDALMRPGALRVAQRSRCKQVGDATISDASRRASDLGASCGCN